VEVRDAQERDRLGRQALWSKRVKRKTGAITTGLRNAARTAVLRWTGCKRNREDHGISKLAKEFTPSFPFGPLSVSSNPSSLSKAQA
jgi:hypothetical protein